MPCIRNIIVSRRKVRAKDAVIACLSWSFPVV
ncbi:hypothetical protein AAKU55_004941 [Oxalobacteraceae bacterium GrIS 1.11]